MKSEVNNWTSNNNYDATASWFNCSYSIESISRSLLLAFILVPLYIMITITIVSSSEPRYGLVHNWPTRYDTDKVSVSSSYQPTPPYPILRRESNFRQHQALVGRMVRLSVVQWRYEGILNPNNFRQLLTDVASSSSRQVAQKYQVRCDRLLRSQASQLDCKPFRKYM